MQHGRVVPTPGAGTSLITPHLLIVPAALFLALGCWFAGLLLVRFGAGLGFRCEVWRGG